MATDVYNGSIPIEGFTKEFSAYNFSTYGLARKIYIRPAFHQFTGNSLRFSLTSSQSSAIYDALKNPMLALYKSDRYRLYDISLRDSGSAQNIGFCFNDSNDRFYIEPYQVFEPFAHFGIDVFVRSIVNLQKRMFSSFPSYNPIFMIGLVAEQSALQCIKAYIRYDLNEVPTTRRRLEMIRHILNLFNFKTSSFDAVLHIASMLELTGFTFSFVGIDCNKHHEFRYKLYFRAYSDVKWFSVQHTMQLILSLLNFDKYFQLTVASSNTSVWGAAISLDASMHINGIQLYFYP